MDRTGSAGNTIPAPLTKRALAIDVMKANSDKPMEVVVDLIARANQITLNAARSYYKWIGKNGLAPANASGADEAEATDPNRRIYRPRAERNPKLAAMIDNRRSNRKQAAA